MVAIEVDSGEGFGVDRSGDANHYPKHLRQGFYISIGGAEIRFDDEADAEADAKYLAKMILWRLGSGLDASVREKPVRVP